MKDKKVALIAYEPTFTMADLHQRYAWVYFDYGEDIYFRLRFASIDDAERQLLKALDAVRDLRKVMPKNRRLEMRLRNIEKKSVEAR